ncbi:MAG TPA: gluconeogenesis factor YvcK family protein [Chloroflexota bacterium]
MTDHIVMLGGGTGLFTALSGLRRHDVDLTAVVTMADSGGSSGRLRDEFGTLPAGDVRRCLVALAADDTVGLLLRQLFEYRFERGEGLAGHSFGNLLLTALDDLTGSMDHAIAEAAHLLRVKGEVLPVTLERTHLHAALTDGTILEREGAIDQRRDTVPIDHVYLDPPAQATDAARTAILSADMVVIGPGDLYTSLLPALLVEGVREALAESPATTVYVCNVMTKHGETDSYAASDFLRVITQYLGENVLDAALLSYYESIPRDVLARYQEQHSGPVSIDQERCYEYAPRLVVRPLAAAGTLVRHDPERLASALLTILAESKSGRAVEEAPV